MANQGYPCYTDLQARGSFHPQPSYHPQYHQALYPQHQYSQHQYDQSQYPQPQHHNGGRKPRKARTNYTAEQVAVFENMFTTRQYPSTEERNELATSLGLTDAQVKTWFQNRRAKLKKQGGMVGAAVTQISASSSPETDQNAPDETVRGLQEAADMYDGLLQLD